MEAFKGIVILVVVAIIFFAVITAMIELNERRKQLKQHKVRVAESRVDYPLPDISDVNFKKSVSNLVYSITRGDDDARVLTFKVSVGECSSIRTMYYSTLEDAKNEYEDDFINFMQVFADRNSDHFPDADKVEVDKLRKLVVDIELKLTATTNKADKVESELNQLRKELGE